MSSTLEEVQRQRLTAARYVPETRSSTAVRVAGQTLSI